MKSTGIVRKMDNLGRVVIPIELRRALGIEVSDGIEIFTAEDRIVLRKYNPGCIFCGNLEDTLEAGGKLVCEKCAQGIARRLT